MARISAKASQAFVTAATSHVFANPPAHVAGNYLVVHCVTDLGTGVLSAPAGWTEIGTQVSVQAQRSAWFAKVAASSNEGFTLSLTTSLAANITYMVCEGVDTLDPINGNARNDSGVAHASTSPALTTDEDNCLLIYAWGYDGNGELGIQPNDLNYVSKIDSTVQQVVGWKVKRTAGAIPSVTAVCTITSEGGTAMVLALNDDGTGKFAPEYETYNILRRYGGFGNINSTLNATNMSNCSITDILGISASNDAVDAIDNVAEPLAPWGNLSRIRWNTPIGSGVHAIVGVVDVISATDFTNKIVSLQWQPQAVSGIVMGDLGYMIGFEDASGNWAVFQLASTTLDTTILFGVNYVNFIAVDSATPFDSSGAIDWTNITKIIHCHHKFGTSAALTGIAIRDLALHGNTVFKSGTADDYSIPDELSNAMEDWGQYLLVARQTDGQVLNRVGFQIGDGTIETHYKASATAYALPLSYSANNSRKFWNVPASQVEFRLKASPNCVFDLSAHLMTTTTKQTFIIDPASSISADYNFSGLVLSGWDIIGKAGVVFNGATFDSCYEVTLNGGGLQGAIVSNSLDPVAVNTDDPEAITNTSFISAGTGHAIEATAPGTFAFEGNTFTGYGADGSTDAAFYNNSGGLITLTVPAGETAPTIRNGAGASTVIDTPVENQKVTLNGVVVGSRVQIYDLTSDTELVNNLAAATTVVWEDSNPYIADREIRIRVSYVDGLEAKEFIEAVIGTLTEADPQVIYLVNQVDDDVYNSNAVDGSAVTNITIDDSVMLIQVDATTVSWAQMYAYELYWLSTEEGIQEIGQTIVAPDNANYIVDGSLIQIINVSGDELTVTGGWGRDKTSGFGRDIFSTAGDGIFPDPPHVVPYALLDNPVITGSIDDISPSIGEILSNTDATQAKVNEL